MRYLNTSCRDEEVTDIEKVVDGHGWNSENMINMLQSSIIGGDT